MTTLFADDFSAFAIGEFPYDPDHSAMGEYQYIMPAGERRGWVDQICNYTWNGTGPTWIITEAGGRHFMESCRVEQGRPHRIFPTLQTGSIFWRDYHAQAAMRRLSTRGVAGLCFCMQNSLNTLVFQMDAGGVALIHRHKENLHELARADFANNCDDYYVLRVECDGEQVRCFVDNIEVLRYSSPLVARGGKIGISADCPTQFTDVKVLANEGTVAEIVKMQADAQNQNKAHQNANPAMRLWKKIDLQNFGTSRQIRFGHLCGGEQWHIVLAQAQKRVSRDAYPHISCLTAIDLDGNILWQRGEPSENAAHLGKISADLPFQIYDIDGDGADEVVCAINFEILILDGATGRVKHRAKTPKTDYSQPIIGATPGGYAFDRLNVDAISFANLSGGERPLEILIKDRYCRLFALNSRLEPLWAYHSTANTGHFPLVVDINNDGRDEVLCGYHLLSADGKKLWEYPIATDHVDEIVFGKFMASSDEGYFACVAGSEGFYIGDIRGNIIMRDGVGHAQRISIANFDPAREGLEIIVSNFWGHQGILYIYDSQGNPICEIENELNGNLITPINWKGDGHDYFLTNADPHIGGLFDINGNQMVAFPDDGHPTLCAEAIDLTGDARDELVVWDYNSLWIYTQTDEQNKTHAPKKAPHHNASNYRGEYSFGGK